MSSGHSDAGHGRHTDGHDLEHKASHQGHDSHVGVEHKVHGSDPHHGAKKGHNEDSHGHHHEPPKYGKDSTNYIGVAGMLLGGMAAAAGILFYKR